MRNRIILLLCIVGILSCQKESSQNSTDLIAMALAQKIETFKENKRNECYETIYSDAEMLVDSIIAQQLNLDTIDFPTKPNKPNSPSIKAIPEEFKLMPIKKKSDLR